MTKTFFRTFLFGSCLYLGSYSYADDFGVDIPPALQDGSTAAAGLASLPPHKLPPAQREEFIRRNGLSPILYIHFEAKTPGETDAEYKVKLKQLEDDFIVAQKFARADSLGQVRDRSRLRRILDMARKRHKRLISQDKIK